MRSAFTLSLRLHLGWFIDSLRGRGRRLAPLGARRLILLLLVFPAFLALQALHWIGFFLDELLFRDYRKVVIREPLVISGIPRSGTTFVHRALAGDPEGFTTFRTWEALLAPSITERKVLLALSRADRLLGRPASRLFRWLLRRSTGGFSHIHEVGLQEPEEDFLALLPAGGCFLLVLAFPASRSVWQLGRFHEMPDSRRETLMGFYKACLQKHLYVHGPGKRLLSKNAGFASWLPDLRAALPDARYLLCVREPDDALSSQLSSLRPGLGFFGTLPAGELLTREFQGVFSAAYRTLSQVKAGLPDVQCAVIDQRRLGSASKDVLIYSLQKLEIPLMDGLLAAIDRACSATGKTKSGHRHKSLSDQPDPVQLDPQVQQLYEDLTDKPAT